MNPDFRNSSFICATVLGSGPSTNTSHPPWNLCNATIHVSLESRPLSALATIVSARCLSPAPQRSIAKRGLGPTSPMPDHPLPAAVGGTDKGHSDCHADHGPGGAAAIKF